MAAVWESHDRGRWRPGLRAGPGRIRMATILKVLMVEDSPNDSFLLADRLGTIGFEVDWKRVDREDDYRSNLRADVQVIFSDFTLPGFSPQKALQILQETGFDIPFIVISGTIGEERAVEILKAGATDYLLKDRLQRLGQVITRAL